MSSGAKAFRVMIIGLILALFVATFPWNLMYLSLLLQPNPRPPDITYGEFPFRLEYEIDGERFVIEDIFIAEFSDIVPNSIAVGSGFRRWDGHIASTGERRVVLLVDGSRRIYAYVGDAAYYMNDERWPRREPLTPTVVMTEIDDTGRIRTLHQTLNREIFEPYNLYIISWEFSDPIESIFR